MRVAHSILAGIGAVAVAIILLVYALGGLDTPPEGFVPEAGPCPIPGCSCESYRG